MPQIIGIVLLYFFVTLTVKKVFLESLKTVFYIFAFFTKILGIKIFNKNSIKYKIKFRVKVT